jgi:hypothetical protein
VLSLFSFPFSILGCVVCARFFCSTPVFHGGGLVLVWLVRCWWVGSGMASSVLAGQICGGGGCWCHTGVVVVIGSWFLRFWSV